MTDAQTSQGQSSQGQTSQGQTSQAEALRVTVAEVERHASAAGWDQPGQLYALVATDELAAAEPELAAELGAGRAAPGGGFTPVEQELADSAEPLEGLLGQIMWPDSVAGALAVVERVVLPPPAEEAVPEDAEAARAYAAEHPARQDVRMAAGVLRTGESHCVLRLRSHDDDRSLLHGADLVPGLVAALRETLEP